MDRTEKAIPEEYEEIEVGKRYKIDLSDCCVRCVFTATLVKIEWPEEFRKLEPDAYRFDNGVTVHEAPTHKPWFREIPEE